MDKFLFQAFQSLPNTEVSDSLHASIFRAAAFRRSWRYVTVLTVVLGLVSLFSFWHLYTRAVDVEAFSTVRAIATSFDLSMDSIADSAKMLLDALPIQAIVITLLNFAAFVFMIMLSRSFSRIQKQFNM
jgi:hypothetical protein